MRRGPHAIPSKPWSYHARPAEVPELSHRRPVPPLSRRCTHGSPRPLAPPSPAIARLHEWLFRWSAGRCSRSTGRHARSATRARPLAATDDMATRATAAAQRLGALDAAVGTPDPRLRHLAHHLGEINRFQRLTGAIVQRWFDDAGASIPVPFTSARWGSLASFGARTYPGTKRMYGTYGNTFVAVVEFGRDSVRARR